MEKPKYPFEITINIEKLNFGLLFDINTDKKCDWLNDLSKEPFTYFKVGNQKFFNKE